MKKKTIVGMFLMLLFISFIGEHVNAQGSAIEDKVLKMATNSSFPPYEFIEDGEIVGIDVDIAEAIAKKLGYKLEILDMEFNTIISSIESGKANVGLAGMTVTEDRKTSVNFSTPYANSVQVIVVKVDSTINNIDDIKGKKIGTQLGTTGDIYAQDDFGEEFVQSFDKHADAILALKADKIDLVMVDEMTAKSLVKNNSELKILDTPYADEDYAIAVNKGNPDLLKEINQALEEMKNDGTLKTIIGKYIVGEQDENSAKLNFIEQIKLNLAENNRWEYLARGLKITLIVTFFSLIIGFVLGMILALIKLAHKDLQPAWDSLPNILLNIGNAIAQFFVSFIRGTPTMVQLLIMYNIILMGVKNLPIVAIATFGINSSAYMSEIFRGGFKAVNSGEIQAARALGLSYYQTFKKIVLPQALKFSLPALGNETITLLKETSIAGAIGLMELTRGSNIIISQTFSALVPYLVTALIYYTFVLILEKLFKTLEGKMTYVKNK